MVPLKPYGKDALPIPKNSPLRVISYAIIGLWFLVPMFGLPLFATTLFDNDLGVFAFVGFFVWFIGFFGVRWLANALIRIFMRSMVGAITLEASSYTIQRNGALLIRLHQPGNENRTLENVTLQLVKHEWVEYSCGTNTCRDTHDDIIAEEQFKPKAGADYETTFQIPANAMHTFNSSNNRIQWFVTIRLDIPAWPDYFERYEVRCLASGENF